MRRKDRFKAFVHYFSNHQPSASTELNYGSPFQLLVAVVLSAQCTDKRVNQVTPALFEAFPTPQQMAQSSFEELFPYISSISYPKNKTKYLIQAAQILQRDFEGQVPESVEDLQKLPGVGRKTAHVIVSVLYGQAKLAVDTHVFRVAKRIGLASSKATTPLAVEKELVKHLAQKHLPLAHHWLILHGRYTCLARRPKCVTCPLTSFCSYFQKTKDALEV